MPDNKLPTSPALLAGHPLPEGDTPEHKFPNAEFLLAYLQRWKEGLGYGANVELETIGSDLRAWRELVREWKQIARAQGVTEPKRLTDEEIETVARMHGTGGWQTLASMMTFARAIEAAVLGVAAPKNGD